VDFEELLNGALCRLIDELGRKKSDEDKKAMMLPLYCIILLLHIISKIKNT
jgi:hypothetical protein